MKGFTYFAPTEIVFGAGTVEESGELARRYGKKALLVSGKKSSVLAPVYDRLRKNLAAAGIASEHFDGVLPNPTTDTVSAGADLAKRFGADLVIGIGGGSSMDTAKAVAVEASHSGTAWDYLHYTAGPTEKTLPIIAVGTTAGTGSQTTPCAVITNSAKRDKSAIWHRNIFPRVAVVDPALTLSMPKGVSAQTGFDAFCHNFEAYISVNSNPLVEALALDALRVIVKNLPLVLEDGSNIDSRSRMAWADTAGGLVISSGGVTLPHGLGMQVGGHCPQVSHGQALAVLYPAFTRYTWSAAVEKFAALGRILDPRLAEASDKAAAEKSCAALDAFLKRIGLWIGFKDLGVTKEELRTIADCGQVLGDYKNNPRVATIDEMYTLLLDGYERT
jgi:alcohol dehydrogenase class IV